MNRYYWIEQEDLTENGKEFYQAKLLKQATRDAKTGMLKIVTDYFFPVGSIFYLQNDCDNVRYFIKCQEGGLYHFLVLREDGSKPDKADLFKFRMGRRILRTGFYHDKKCRK